MFVLEYVALVICFYFCFLNFGFIFFFIIHIIRVHLFWHKFLFPLSNKLTTFYLVGEKYPEYRSES